MSRGYPNTNVFLQNTLFKKYLASDFYCFSLPLERSEIFEMHINSMFAAGPINVQQM
jgi:hypothetical protein